MIYLELMSKYLKIKKWIYKRMPISTLSNNNYLHNTNPKRQNSPLSNLESLKV